MSLTKVTNSMILGAPLNVLDFGADATGATSSQAAFDAVFAKAAIDGSPVYMPTGTYLLDDISLTDGQPVGNGNKYGQQMFGDGVGKTILKCSGASDKFLSFLGSPGNYFYVYFKAQDFTIDMSLMPNDADSIGIYAIYAYGGSVSNVTVVDAPALASSLYLDQGCYTTVWQNCDFGGTTGRLKVIGVGVQPVTTQTFIACSWGQYISDNAQTNQIISCIVQGALTPKFVLSEQYGLSIIAGDFEGSGVLYAFGTGCNQICSMNAGMVGFTGDYYTGTINSGMLMDQVYPVKVTGDPMTISNQAVSAGAVASGFVTALVINGTINENVRQNGAVRKVIDNTSNVANQVDLAFDALNGTTFVGQDATGNSYLDGRGTTRVTLQQNGTDRLGVVATGELFINTTKAMTAGSVAGYFTVSDGTNVYKIPYHAV
jgi:hypothetical protein